MKSILFTLCAIYLSIGHIQCDVTVTSVHAEIQRPIWGDVSPPYYFQAKMEKFGVPFITRCNSVEFPLDISTDAGQAKVVPPLRGIAHVNLVDKKETDCDEPDVQIKEGNYEGPFAKVKVCSKTGCPLNSIIYFYTRK